jgi:hypothetical protein
MGSAHNGHFLAEGYPAARARISSVSLHPIYCEALLAPATLHLRNALPDTAGRRSAREFTKTRKSFKDSPDRAAWRGFGVAKLLRAR